MLRHVKFTTEASAFTRKAVKINILTKFVKIRTALKINVTKGTQTLANLVIDVHTTSKTSAYIHIQILPLTIPKITINLKR